MSKQLPYSLAYNHVKHHIRKLEEITATLVQLQHTAKSIANHLSHCNAF